MSDFLKKAVYAGIGLVDTLSEEAQKNFQAWQEKGKSSRSEAKKLIDEFFEKTTTAREELEEKINEVVEKFGYTRKEEVEALRRRIQELEEQLAQKAAQKVAAEA